MYEDVDEFDLKDGGVQFGSLKDLLEHDKSSYSDQKYAQDEQWKRPELFPTEHHKMPSYKKAPFEPHTSTSFIPPAPAMPEYKPTIEKKVNFPEPSSSFSSTGPLIQNGVITRPFVRQTPAPAASSTPAAPAAPAAAPTTSTHTTHYIGYPSSYVRYSPLYDRLYNWSLGYIPSYYSYSERKILENAIESLLKKELADNSDESLLKSVVKKFLDEKINKPSEATKSVARKQSKKRSKKSKKKSVKKSKKKSPKKSPKKSKKKSHKRR